MFVFGPLLVIASIGFFCWLMFTVAVFALPLFVGLTIGVWALHTGAGAFGGIIVGVVAGGAAFGLGQIAIAFLQSAWLRLLIILLFVAPATFAGYNATYGIAQIAMTSASWQVTFSVIGAIAVSITTFIRFTGVALHRPDGQEMARGYGATRPRRDRIRRIATDRLSS